MAAANAWDGDLFVRHWLYSRAADLLGAAERAAADDVSRWGQDHPTPTLPPAHTRASECHVIPRDGCMWLEHYPPGSEGDEFGCLIAIVDASESVARIAEMAAGHVCGLSAVETGEATGC